MIKPTARRLGLTFVAFATVALGLTTPAHAAGGTGSITGVITKNGTPIADAYVSVNATDTDGWGSAMTDPAGRYTITGLSAGHYKVSVNAPGEPNQYAYQQANWDTATVYQVTAGGQTTADDALLPTGTFTGRFVDRNGNGVPWMNISITGVGTTNAVSGSTDQAGNFTLNAFADTYQVGFSNGSMTQYAVGTTDYRQATHYTIAVGQTITINETQLPMGTVEGRFVDRDGNGLADVGVSVESDLGGYYTTTDATGNYHIDGVYVGSYRVRFESWERNALQYAHGKIDSAEAEMFAVTEDTTTTVNDTLLPTGSVHLTVTDALTGQPVPSFYASVGQVYVNGTDGSALAENVTVGNEWYNVYAEGYLTAPQARVLVSDGQVTELAVALTPASKITAHVVDAQNGAPVTGFCVLAAPTIGGYAFGDGCNATDENGDATITNLTAGSYNVMAFRNQWDEPLSPYGAQWVGAAGGTGDQTLATVITVGTGETKATPTVKLDKAGTITGTVTGADDKPIGHTWVQFGNFHYHSGDGVLSLPVDASGHYSVTFLGPYKWPLHFMSDNFGPQWSGGAGSRLLAKQIKVKANATVVYDVKLKKATTVSITGDSPGWIVAYDAATGEVSGVCDSSTGSCQMQIRGPQTVKIMVWAAYPPDFWSGGTDFASATGYAIPDTGAVSIALTH